MPFEHLSNCHGELTMLAQAFAAIPLVGAWVAALWVKYGPRLNHQHPHP